MLAAKLRTARDDQQTAIKKPNRAASAVPCQAKARVLASAWPSCSVAKKSGVINPLAMRSSSWPGLERAISMSASNSATRPARARPPVVRRQRLAVVFSGGLAGGMVGHPLLRIVLIQGIKIAEGQRPGGGVEDDLALVQADDPVAAGQCQRPIMQGNHGTVVASQ